MNWNDHKKVVALLRRAQESSREMRERCREQIHFIKDRDGQWEQGVKAKMGERPRYQFDRTTVQINTIAGEIEQNEFAARVLAKGEKASGDLANTYDQMLRSIQSLSKAEDIYKDAGRRIVTCGFDGWLVATDWADVDAFEQDILVQPVPDAMNRIWLDSTVDTEREKTAWGFLLTALDREEYDETYTDRKGTSLPNGRDFDVYEHNEDEVIIGDCYYLKYQKRTIHLLSDGRVVDDEQYQPVAARYALQGITVERSRERKIPVCYMRPLDGDGWLGSAKETPFAYVPLVCAYGNYDVVENKQIYFGEVERLMDPQRVYNYARSREIEEGALAPRRKIMMTQEQAAGHERQLSTLNTNADPVQFYTHAEGQMPPFETGGPQINPALANTAQQAAIDMQEISGRFNASVGKPITGHSGKAYELLQNKSDVGNVHYQMALKRAIAHTGKIIVDAIPKVYDTASRQIRLMNEDGTIEFKSVNDETPKGIVRDLSQGHYDVTCVTGASFQNRKTEGLNAMLDLMKIDPTILQDGRDILIKSMDAPYIDQLADRVRAQMIREGRIPEPQLTDDERDKITQESENQQPDPMQEITIAVMQSQIKEAEQRMMIEMKKAIDDGIAKRAQAILNIEKAQATSQQSVMDMARELSGVSDKATTVAE